FEDLGYLQGQQIIEELQKSHANFVIVPALNEYALVTKIYDYAIGNSHILIIGGEGELSDWCDSIEQKYTLVEGDRTAISDTLSKLYLQWKNNQLEYGCNEVKLAEFGRHALALKYANLIKKEFE
ncbi:MAG: hypothetical protein GOP50_08105, partial [Candidatus Heimdallarchaeota archaeon]|nr:hypothetical protein [Candidatus Heimdallarchaeota archaeon]